MSTRTIIEINHDYLHDLFRNPDELVAFVKRLGAGLDWAEKAKPNGLRILGQRHHSETLKLTVR